MPNPPNKKPNIALIVPLALIVVVAAVMALRDTKPSLPEGPWRAYSEKALEEAKAANKPVLIDLYADWCMPCKELDRQIFQHPQFLSAAGDFVLLKGNLTNKDKAEVRRVGAKYQVVGFPTVIFVDRHGKERTDLRLVGGISDWNLMLEEFLLRMDLARTGAPPPTAPPRQQ